MDLWLGRKGFKDVKNDDLWRRFIPLYKTHQIHFHWVKGHSGHPENEIVDRLAVEAISSGKLSIDAFFEQQKNGGLF